MMYLNRLKSLLKSKSGNGFVEIIGMLIVAFMLLAMFINIANVFVKKLQLDYFTNELCRTAELYGQIGAQTNARNTELAGITNINPTISWSKSGKLALKERFTVTLSMTVDVGFGDLGSFPITIQSRRGGQGEVYWKD